MKPTEIEKSEIKDLENRRVKIELKNGEIKEGIVKNLRIFDVNDKLTSTFDLQTESISLFDITDIQFIE